MPTHPKSDRLFAVWDPLNSEREEAETIEARSPLDAAEFFANADTDGHTDGLYTEGHPLAVEDCTGDVAIYEVAFVGHPEDWHEALSESASLRAVRLVTGPEREVYLQGRVPKPSTLTQRQREALANGLESEGFGDFFGQYTTLEYFESRHGPLPDDLARAWREYDRVRLDLQHRLLHHRATPDQVEAERRPLTDARRFPILTDRRRHSSACPRSVPWSLVAPHEEQAQRNHGGQTLERLAERGGLAPIELMAVVQRRSWQSIDPSEAEAWLVKFIRGEERDDNG